MTSNHPNASDYPELVPFIKAAHRALAMQELMRAVPASERDEAGLGGYSTILSAATSAASDFISFRDWEKLAERFPRTPEQGQ
jgi:hypothetical protein